MNVAIVILHLDCPSITSETATPPKLLLTHGAGSIHAVCPGCDQRLTVDITPIIPAKAAT